MGALAFLTIASLALATNSSVVLEREAAAPLITPPNAQLLPDQYIVVMKGGVGKSSAQDIVQTLNIQPNLTYSKIIQGFSATLGSEAVEALWSRPEIAYIEQDAIITISDYETQSNAPWGLSRISSNHSGGSQYVYDESSGEGTCSYVVDTGMEIQHPEFEGRAERLKNFVWWGKETDENGHGTHVAGTIGSKTFGVAKKTKLFAVKVLDRNGTGTISGVIGGLDSVADDWKNNDRRRQSCPKGAVANMSLGGTRSKALNEAVKGVAQAGVFIAVAAGNNRRDAKNDSPASEESACTVGATQKDDAIAVYSNYGGVVNIFAPGTDILSTWISPENSKPTSNETKIMSGTSMATPHVCGLAAYLLAFEKPRSPADLCQRIQDHAKENERVAAVPAGTTDYLAFNGYYLT